MQGEACVGRFLSADRLPARPRTNLRNCHCRRLHGQVFGSGLRALLSPRTSFYVYTHARLSRTHARTAASCRLICTDAGHSRLGPGGVSPPRLSPAERSSSPAAASEECAGTGAPSDRRTPAPPGSCGKSHFCGVLTAACALDSLPENCVCDSGAPRWRSAPEPMFQGSRVPGFHGSVWTRFSY